MDATRERRARWHGSPRGLSRPLLVLLSLQLMGGMVLSPHRTFYPLYLKGLAQPVLAISALATAQQVMGLVGAWLGGSLADALGRKWTLFLGQAGALLGCLAFLLPSVGWIAPLWLLSGLCGGLHTVAAQSLLLEVAPAQSLGVSSALYNWGYTLGGAVGSPIAGLLLNRHGYFAFGLGTGLVAAVALAANWALLPSSHRGTAAAGWRQVLGGYGDVAARPAAMVLGLLRFLPTCYWGMALILIPLLLDAAGAGKPTIALYVAFSQVLASAGQIAVGRVADRWGCQGVTVATYGVLTVSALAIGIWPDRLWAVLAGGAVGTAAAWSLSTLMPSLVARVTAPAARGRTLGWVHLWWNLGMIAGSMVGGVTFGWGHGAPFLIASALNLAAIVLAFAFFGRAGQVKANQMEST